MSFSVHALPTPGEGVNRRRVLSGRWRMSLVLLACAAPVLASYFAYYVIRPDGRSNYSTLVQPSRTWPAAVALRDLTGAAVDAASLRGQWLLVMVGPGACDAGCEQRVYLQRQVREMLGRERDRVDRVWLLTDETQPSPALLDAAQATGTMTVLRADRGALSAWLQAAQGQALEDHLYIVDPMGEWMMRAPTQAEPARLKRDLDRLLRASSFWDKAGR